MANNVFRVTTHLLANADVDKELIGTLDPVVSRPVSVVYPPDFIDKLVAKFSEDQSVQIAFNHNVAEVRKEFDALKNFLDLGLLPRTSPETEQRYIDSAALLDQRNPSIQKAYENMFYCSLNLLAISRVFEDRTGEALPLNIERARQ